MMEVQGRCYGMLGRLDNGHLLEWGYFINQIDAAVSFL